MSEATSSGVALRMIATSVNDVSILVTTCKSMSRERRLAVVLFLNLVLVVLLVVVGAAAHSAGVLAEGIDYLADAAAIGVYHSRG